MLILENSQQMDHLSTNDTYTSIYLNITMYASEVEN